MILHERGGLPDPMSRLARLEQELERIHASRLWQLLLRWRAWKARLARLGPLGGPLTRVAHVLETVATGRVGSRRPGTPEPLARWPGRLRRRRGVLRVPPMTSPRGTSIVIPVHDRSALTARCLAAVIQRTPPGTYEVIVIDNGSTDRTADVLARAEGLRVIRNTRNEGFGPACNQGLAVATGEFVAFLNNDTVVTENWLGPLVATLEGDPSIGAVGAQLLFPDGRLQEAGGVVGPDGRAWHYGRGDDPQRPEYRYVREVDYCSAACLLVRRTVLERFGGFDPAYAPAYYEDVDLCFRLRAHGFRVVYQPRARVVHVEGGTAGPDPRRGLKRYQERHREIFRARHAAALAAQPEPDPANLFRSRDRKPGRRILVIDHTVPRDDQDAGSMRMTALLGLLGELGHAVTLLPNDPTPAEPYTEDLQQGGVEVLHGLASPFGYLGTHLRDFDVAIVSRAAVGLEYLPWLATHPGAPPIVFDTVDLHHLRERRQAELDGDPGLARLAAVRRATELYLADLSDMVWAVSTYEADLLRRERPGIRVGVVPTVHAVRPAVPPLDRRADLMFIGGFRHPPNTDAVLHFAARVLPLVHRELPEARFVVVGSNVPPEVAQLASARIRVLGWVRDVDPVFAATRVFVAPLRFGAGIKGKIGQALAHGVPVVTTSIGAEGLGLVDGEHALIADTPEAFAAAVVRLYRNPALWQRLSEAGRRHVDRSFGPAAVRERLRRLLDELPARSAPRRSSEPRESPAGGRGTTGPAGPDGVRAARPERG